MSKYEITLIVVVESDDIDATLAELHNLTGMTPGHESTEVEDWDVL